MQTWISLLAENEGSQVMDTECSKEKFLTMCKRLSCLQTPSTVRPCRRDEARSHMETNNLDLDFGRSCSSISGYSPPN